MISLPIRNTNSFSFCFVCSLQKCKEHVGLNTAKFERSRPMQANVLGKRKQNNPQEALGSSLWECFINSSYI